MIRILTGILLSVVAGVTAVSQSPQAPTPREQAASPQPPAWLQNKAEVLRVIDLDEAEVRQSDASNAYRMPLAATYSELGVLYLDAGMGLKAEDAFRRAIALLKDGPPDQLANELEQLAVLHSGMSEFREAEKEEMEALAIRQTLRDSLGVALAENAIAGIYDVQGKFAKARNHAQKAYEALTGRTDVSAQDRIEVWHTRGYALTGSHDCDRGIGVLKDALQMARSSPGWGDASVGYSEYLLGIGYWHCGDWDHAAAWLQRGTGDLKAEFGWNRATYVCAMKQYALFLRRHGKKDEAASAESLVRQAESVVDANTLTGRTEAPHNLSP